MEKTSDDDLQAIIDDNSGSTYGRAFVQALARELQEERKQPKVFSGAQKWATTAKIVYEGRSKSGVINNSSVSQTYTRDLPKSPIREIAERIAEKHSSIACSRQELEDIANEAITEAMALKA